MNNIDFNAVVRSTAQGLSMGADPADMAKGLVDRFGAEHAFLLYHAAKAYLAIPEPVIPEES